MTESRTNQGISTVINERRLSVLVHSLFSAWMLAFLFEGQIFYSLTDAYKIDPGVMVFCGVAAIFAGLLLCGLFIKTKRAAKRLFLCSYLFFIAISVNFFFPTSVFWTGGIIVGSLLAGGCVAAWAFPYIAALFIMRNLPQRIDRTYILYVAIAMIGLSFIGFMCLGRGALSYLAINTLMLGAFGVYDLFWWSILGEMLELYKNPARILGLGLSANVLGVLLGKFIGDIVTSSNVHSPNPTLLALAVVCVTLVLLPPLPKHLSSLLNGHAYLSEFSELPKQEQAGQFVRAARFGNLSERESQVVTLLLQGKTYKTIAGELTISENTIKYYVKNIYSKFGIQSRAERINIVLKKEYAPPPA